MQHIFLQVKDIKKSYKTKKGTIDALKGVSFDLYQGEIFGLLGANGAGKTTLSSILATLHPATSGDVLIDGKSIYRDLLKYRFDLGFCPQIPNVNAKLTVKDQLVFAGRFYGMSKQEAQDRAKVIIEKFNLGAYVDQMPGVLSGGFKQRLMIGRTLMHSPKLVIFDEPTVGLDPNIRRQLWDLIKQLKSEGVTIILTTHYLDEAEQLADRVCILDKGKIRLIDTPANLKKLHASKTLEDVFVKLLEEETGEINELV